MPAQRSYLDYLSSRSDQFKGHPLLNLNQLNRGRLQGILCTLSLFILLYIISHRKQRPTLSEVQIITKPLDESSHSAALIPTVSTESWSNHHDYDTEDEYEYQFQNLSLEKAPNQCTGNYINAFNMYFINESSPFQCSDKFNHCGDDIPFLFSYGGSGNTLTRVILEHITNAFTGSIYPYKDPYFGGNDHCGSDVVVIKAHPEHLNDTKLIAVFNGRCSMKDCVCSSELEITPKSHLISNQVLNAPNPTFNEWTFNGIFIVRNPWNAMWALYQFHHGSGCKKYEDVPAHIRHIYWRNPMTDDCTLPLKTQKLWDPLHFANELVTISVDEWLRTFQLMVLMDRWNRNYVVIRFENLVQVREPMVAMKEMDKMMRYLLTKSYYQTKRELIWTKIECIVAAMTMPGKYGRKTVGWRRFGRLHRIKPETESHVSMEMAFQTLNDSVICRIWKRIKPQAEAFGYEIWKDTSCS